MMPADEKLIQDSANEARMLAPKVMSC
jgi:hypothetical protein